MSGTVSSQALESAAPQGLAQTDGALGGWAADGGNGMNAFATIEQAIADIAAGRPVIVVDDEGLASPGPAR